MKELLQKVGHLNHDLVLQNLCYEKLDRTFDNMSVKIAIKQYNKVFHFVQVLRKTPKYIHQTR